MDEKKPRKSAARRRIDWSDVRRRFDLAWARAARTEQPSPAEVSAILEARAATLARALDAGSQGATIDVLDFVLAHERYAVEARYVREVSLLDNLTPLPCTPEFVLGIMNVRGRILSVLDIRKFFGLPEKGITDLNRIIVLESGAMVFGILADEIGYVRSLPVTAMQGPSPSLAGISEQYLMGVMPDGLVVLDAGALLTDETMIVQDHVEERAG